MLEFIIFIIVLTVIIFLAGALYRNLMLSVLKETEDSFKIAFIGFIPLTAGFLSAVTLFIYLISIGAIHVSN